MKRTTATLFSLVIGTVSATALAAPYTPVVLPPGAFPTVGPGVIPAPLVFGKEYSHDLDHDFMGVADPERVVAWDGVGGTLNGVDYSFSRGGNFPREQQVDALANTHDALYRQLWDPVTGKFDDTAHLVFSIDDRVAAYTPAGGLVFPPAGALLPASGPVPLTNGDVIGGSADISIEESGFYAGFEVQGLWTPAPTINGMTLLRDVDGLELWGPEPAATADSDKYSLDEDVPTGGISVWNYDLGTGLSSPYIPHGLIVAAVESLLGGVPTTAISSHESSQGRNAVNLDALMVQDLTGSDFLFENDPAGGASDSIIFSIRQMPDPADPDGYYATGSELFVLSAPVAGGPVTAGFLFHGGHAWDHLYTLGAMGIPGGNFRAYVDINALEAIGELVVPEPATLVTALALTMNGCVLRRRR